MGDLTSSDLVERLSPTSDSGTVGIGAWAWAWGRAGSEIGDGKGTSLSKVGSLRSSERAIAVAKSSVVGR
ncbi:hypothetical protein Dimus_024192 [Dionaea muscipula]